MDRILNDLNQAVGILGSMILTKDGDYVCGSVGGEVNADTGAALGADIVRGCRQHLDAIGKADFSQFMIETMNGKIVIFDAGPAYLFVVANQHLRLNMTILDIRSAAMRIRKELS